MNFAIKKDNIIDSLPANILCLKSVFNSRWNMHATTFVMFKYKAPINSRIEINSADGGEIFVYAQENEQFEMHAREKKHCEMAENWDFFEERELYFGDDSVYCFLVLYSSGKVDDRNSPKSISLKIEVDRIPVPTLNTASDEIYLGDLSFPDTISKVSVPVNIHPDNCYLSRDKGKWFLTCVSSPDIGLYLPKGQQLSIQTEIQGVLRDTYLVQNTGNDASKYVDQRRSKEMHLLTSSGAYHLPLKVSHTFKLTGDFMADSLKQSAVQQIIKDSIWLTVHFQKYTGTVIPPNTHPAQAYLLPEGENAFNLYYEFRYKIISITNDPESPESTVKPTALSTAYGNVDTASKRLYYYLIRPSLQYSFLILNTGPFCNSLVYKGNVIETPEIIHNPKKRCETFEFSNSSGNFHAYRFRNNTIHTIVTDIPNAAYRLQPHIVSSARATSGGRGFLQSFFELWIPPN